ncbi:MAG: MBL fold metallo-hydrolase [Opitutales bacterium]
MSMRFRLLGSSSAGNCALLETAQTRILIDAGFSGRQICRRLATGGTKVTDLEAVFLTHEHSDHVAGLRGLSKETHLEFFATYGTASAAQRPLRRELRWRLFEPETTFQFRDLEVTVLRLPHDAHDPVGFVFRSGGDDLFNPPRSVVWMTDLGYVPENLGPLVREADLLVLEANHDLEMLEQDPHRPFSLKQRIRGRHGHLSNEAAADFLRGVANPRWREVILAHISRDCNRADRVVESVGVGQHTFRTTVFDPASEGGDWIELSHW